MTKRKLEIELGGSSAEAIRALDLATTSRERLDAIVTGALPASAVRRLKKPFNSSVPLVVLSYPRNAPGMAFADTMTLFSRLACGTVQSFAEMSADVTSMPLLVFNGGQLADWFDNSIETYYARAVTKRYSSDGIANVNYDPNHRIEVPIVEFAAASLEASYLRLLNAIADLDDSGEDHVELSRIASATAGALAPAGVQFIHLGADGSLATCFRSFEELIEDAGQLVMF